MVLKKSMVNSCLPEFSHFTRVFLWLKFYAIGPRTITEVFCLLLLWQSPWKQGALRFCVVSTFQNTWGLLHKTFTREKTGKIWKLGSINLPIVFTIQANNSGWNFYNQSFSSVTVLCNRPLVKKLRKFYSLMYMTYWHVILMHTHINV